MLSSLLIILSLILSIFWINTVFADLESDKKIINESTQLSQRDKYKYLILIKNIEYNKFLLDWKQNFNQEQISKIEYQYIKDNIELRNIIKLIQNNSLTWTVVNNDFPIIEVKWYNLYYIAWDSYSESIKSAQTKIIDSNRVKENDKKYAVSLFNSLFRATKLIEKEKDIKSKNYEKLEYVIVKAKVELMKMSNVL